MNSLLKIVKATLPFLAIGFSGSTLASACDVDKDGDVDRLDVKLIVIARDRPAKGTDDSRDADGDGKITMLDARSCIRQCDLEGCGIIDPVPRTSTEAASRLETEEARPVRKAADGVSKPSAAASGQTGSGIRRRVEIGGTEWKVKRGDTLYAISRAIYPGDAGKQARLRRDIVKLNPSVFASGANNLSVGAVLKLPDYVTAEGTPAPDVKPDQAPPLVADTITSEPALRSADSSPTIEPGPEKPAYVESLPKVKAAPETGDENGKKPPKAEERPVTTLSDSAGSAGSAMVSLGYSYGGDKLVDIDGSYQVYAGSGAHLRLGYEQINRQGSGYRVALGLQANLVYDSDGSTTYRDTYLQLAYQYRAESLVYGIGAVFHQGATLKELSTREFDAASGGFVYLENVGAGDFGGWGLSYTALETEEKNVPGSIDASRAELYYSWRF